MLVQVFCDTGLDSQEVETADKEKVHEIDRGACCTATGGQPLVRISKR